MNELANLRERVARLEKLVNISTGKQETWVPAKEVMRLTGWNREKLRQARNFGTVRFKREPFRYLLESISPIYLKVKSPNPLQ